MLFIVMLKSTNLKLHTYGRDQGGKVIGCTTHLSNEYTKNTSTPGTLLTH